MSLAGLGRRQLLRMIAAATAAAASGCGDTESLNPVPAADAGTTAFFDADELAAIDALADNILPPDDTPGGAGLGAQAYIVRLLTAFDDLPNGAAPPYHAGGPYSGRTPYPDAHGDPSKEFPPNGFSTFLVLDRVADRGARLLIYGSDGVPGGGPNDAATGKIIGLRDTVKSGLAAAMAGSTQPLSSLDYDSLKAIFHDTDPAFQAAFIELVCEAAFAAPEYGGNVGLSGWKLANFDGDVLPLGFSAYDPSTDSYHERADAPVSTPNPGPDPNPVTADVEAFIRDIAILSGGRDFT